MPTLTHSPADVVAKMLVDMGLASTPAYADAAYTGGAWPAFASGEPDFPDACITVTDTQGLAFGSLQPGGEVVEHEGVQVRLRSQTPKQGWKKARAVQKALAESALDEVVHLPDPDSGDDVRYVVASVLPGAVIAAGKEPGSKRNIFTINATVDVEER